jgi:hypothetical protein
VKPPSGLLGPARAVVDWFFAPADPRAYASLRIGYAIAAFAVLVDLWPLRLALLSSEGMFGGASVNGPASLLNLFLWARSPTAVSAVFVLVGVAIVCLGLGVLPRAGAAVAYLWAVSYTTTVPVAQSGFDLILRIVGFVLLVSPTVKTWSLGAGRDERPPPVYGLRLVQWQLMLIYVTTVWLKAPDEFWRRGDAIPYFLMSLFARFPSPSVANMGALAGLLTFGTILIEASVPFLLWMRKTRFLGVLLGVSLHVGIALSSKLALFTLSILPMYLAYFERQDFDKIANLLRRTAPGLAPPGDAAKSGVGPASAARPH